MCLLALLAPGTAIAKGGHFIIDPSRSEEFRLKGSNGYSIWVYANHGSVQLTARHENEEATYSTRGHTTEGRIRARFGKLGSVAVRLRPFGKPRLAAQPSGNCRGKGDLVTRGMFVGTIAFRGEQLYTTVHATRAHGRETKTFKQICKEEKESGRSPFQLMWLSAQSTQRRSRSESIFKNLTAFKITSKAHPVFDGSFFSAAFLETSGRLSITRTTSVDADPAAFAVSEPSPGATSATIAPPTPFAGSATYLKEKGTPASWSGELTVPLLGVGVVSLTGDGWAADLSRSASRGSGSGVVIGTFS